MRVIVTGASGFIGRSFLKVFSDETVVGTCFSRCGPGLMRVDIRDRAALEGFLTDFAPDVVIHNAARPTVDWCEHNIDDARLLNLSSTVNLAEACGRLSAKLVFLSTDYVFDGCDGPYREDDTTNPINVYGKLKLEAEQAIQERLHDYMIIRTTNVYGFDLQSKNFLMGILPRLARRELVRVAADQYGNPTLVHDLCSAVKRLVERGATGIFHVVGPDFVNRLEWAQSAARVFDLDPELIVGAVTEELAQPAPRPKRCGLVADRAGEILGEPLTDLRNGLSLMKSQWGGAPPIASW